MGGRRHRALGKSRRRRGEVKVTKNKKLLNVLGVGECFGEMAYLSESAKVRGASISANGESRVVRIRVDDLLNAERAPPMGEIKPDSG